MPDLEEAADDPFLVEAEVLFRRRLGQPEGREDPREPIAQRAQLGPQLSVCATGPRAGSLEHATDGLEPSAELADQPIDVVLGDPSLEQGADRADDRLVARVEPTVRERPDLADRHKPFDEGHWHASFF